jgi:hypothetical protein
VKLREWDFNAANQGAYAEVDYPEAIVKEFVDWFRNTRQWRESPEMVYARWLKFERELTDFRNSGEPADPSMCSALTKTGEPCKGKAVRDGLCIAHVIRKAVRVA